MTGVRTERETPDQTATAQAGGVSGKGPSRVREPQPRGAVTKAGHRVNQGEAAERFIASPQHLKIHDGNVWEIRKHRDHARDGLVEWEGSDPNNGDVHYLANVQREATRPIILKAEAGLTGNPALGVPPLHALPGRFRALRHPA